MIRKHSKNHFFQYSSLTEDNGVFNSGTTENYGIYGTAMHNFGALALHYALYILHCA